MKGKENKLQDFKKKYFGRGGNATFKKYGKEHFSKLAKLSWEKRKKHEKNNTRGADKNT